MPVLHADPTHALTWLIAAAAILGILFRPWGLSEALWAVAGAGLLVVGSLLSWSRAWAAVAQGANVYLFLAGMMLLAEIARTQGLFDWIAAHAIRAARGSARRLFILIYVVGILVTALLSNDATAVVMTPAVYAATRHARAEPLPYLLICAFVANAASFLLPIANPANLLVFASHLPPLGPWLAKFLLPSAVALGSTFFVLRMTQRGALTAVLENTPEVPPLSGAARLAASGIGLTVVVLLWASATGRPLGPPTFWAALATVALTLAGARRSPWPLLRGVSWSILPLVAGLFVLVAGLARTGLLRVLRTLIAELARRSGPSAALVAGTAIAGASNVTNNLPMALVAGSLGAVRGVAALHASLLIGVDLGPNLSVTGSLATLLWLIALRRENVRIDALKFFRIGLQVMPPALLAALAVAAFVHPL